MTMVVPTSVLTGVTTGTTVSTTVGEKDHKITPVVMLVGDRGLTTVAHGRDNGRTRGDC